MLGSISSSVFLLLCILAVEGQFEPNFVVEANPSVGINPNPTLTLDCQPSGTPGDVNRIEILKYVGTDMSGSFNSIATVRYDISAGKNIIDWGDSSYENRVTPSTDSAVYPAPSAKLHLTFTRVLCTDGGMYQCKVTAYTTGTGNADGAGTRNVTISSPAGNLTLTIQETGFPGSSFQPTTMSPNPQFDVGTILTMICSGDIGSNKNDIQWCRKMNLNFDFETSPNMPATTHTQSSGAQSCGGWSARSELTYNITEKDILTQFKCFVPDVTQGYTCRSINLPTVTFAYKVSGDGNGGNIGPVVQSANIGAIVGGVIGALAAIVLILLLVYFLWYRRRGEGDDYRTKEEDEARANQPEPYHSAVYSIPDKNRNMGVENKGMDDRHDNRHQYRNDRDRGGQRNRAMDEDDGYDGRTPAGSSV